MRNLAHLKTKIWNINSLKLLSTQNTMTPFSSFNPQHRRILFWAVMNRSMSILTLAFCRAWDSRCESFCIVVSLKNILNLYLRISWSASRRETICKKKIISTQKCKHRYFENERWYIHFSWRSFDISAWKIEWTNNESSYRTGHIRADTSPDGAPNISGLQRFGEARPLQVKSSLKLQLLTCTRNECTWEHGCHV